jgi:hypothetical protein
MADELDARIAAVKAMYAQKTKALLSNISTLEEEVRILKLASKEHNRSKLIAALQQNAQERETVIEVLKAALVLSTGRSRTEIDELVLRKTTGAPEKFRPRSREELALEIAALRKQLEGAQAHARKLEAQSMALLKQQRGGGGAGPGARFGVDILEPYEGSNPLSSALPHLRPAAPPLPGTPGGPGSGVRGHATGIDAAAAAAAAAADAVASDPMATLKLALAAGSAIAAARQRAGSAAAGDATGLLGGGGASSAGLVRRPSSGSDSAGWRSVAGAGARPSSAAGSLRAAVAASRSRGTSAGRDGRSASPSSGRFTPALGADGSGLGSAASGSASVAGFAAPTDSAAAAGAAAAAELDRLRERVAELQAVGAEQRDEIEEMHGQVGRAAGCGCGCAGYGGGSESESGCWA